MQQKLACHVISFTSATMAIEALVLKGPYLSTILIEGLLGKPKLVLLF